MGKERRESDSYRPTPLSPEDYGAIASLLEMREGLGDLGKSQRLLLNKAVGFLRAANLGIQWVDFGNRDVASVGANLQFYEGVRAKVLIGFFPDGSQTGAVSSKLSPDNRVMVQKRLNTFAIVTRKRFEGTPLQQEEQRILPEMVEFFNRLGLKDSLVSHQRGNQ